MGKIGSNFRILLQTSTESCIDPLACIVLQDWTDGFNLILSSIINWYMSEDRQTETEPNLKLLRLWLSSCWLVLGQSVCILIICLFISLDNSFSCYPFVLIRIHAFEFVISLPQIIISYSYLASLFSCSCVGFFLPVSAQTIIKYHHETSHVVSELRSTTHLTIHDPAGKNVSFFPHAFSPVLPVTLK